MSIKYTTTILAFGNNAAVDIPPAKLEELNSGKRPKVLAKLNNSYQFETTVGSHDGKYVLSFSKARRDESGLGAGDTVDVELTLLS